MKISAYVPCHNNSAALPAAIQSLKDQTLPPDELLVIDDGSTDGSAEIARRMGARVIQHTCSLGRGAARARAFAEATGDLVLGLDATCTIEPQFMRDAAGWFDSPKVAGVFARITAPPPSSTVERWRSRHLFKEQQRSSPAHNAPLITASCVLRRAAVLEAGNFSARCRHSEDAERGHRLLAAGWDVIMDPALLVVSHKRDTLASVLDRFWRWHAGPEARVSVIGWWKMSGYAIKVMMRQDFRAGDPLAACISFLLPHYQVWRSLRERREP